MDAAGKLIGFRDQGKNIVIEKARCLFRDHWLHFADIHAKAYTGFHAGWVGLNVVEIVGLFQKPYLLKPDRVPVYMPDEAPRLGSICVDL